MKRNNLVLGYFGNFSKKLDGQTVKTRYLYEAVKKLDTNVAFFDTESLKHRKSNYIKLILLIINSKKIFYLPAHNNLSKFFPILFSLSQFFSIKIYYFMIGGWLSTFLKDKPSITKKLRKIERVFCETEIVKNELLVDFKFENLDYFPNFRRFSHTPILKEINPTCVKLVYVGRINEGKGILDLFKLESMLADESIDNYSISLYGQIDSKFEDRFNQALALSNKVFYKGVLNPNDIYKEIQAYDLMIFPTHFFTEGLPGTVLDAFISGLPIIASEWKHAREFIKDNVNGFIYSFDDFMQLKKKVSEILTTPELLKEKKREAYQSSYMFSEDRAIEILKKIV